MSTNYAVRVNAPGGTVASGGAVAVVTAATTAASLAFTDGGSHATRIWIKADVDTLIHFGASTLSAPTTANSIWLTANVDYVFDLPQSITNARAKKKASASTGTLRWKTVA